MSQGWPGLRTLEWREEVNEPQEGRRQGESPGVHAVPSKTPESRRSPPDSSPPGAADGGGGQSSWEEAGAELRSRPGENPGARSGEASPRCGAAS